MAAPRRKTYKAPSWSPRRGHYAAQGLGGGGLGAWTGAPTTTFSEGAASALRPMKTPFERIRTATRIAVRRDPVANHVRRMMTGKAPRTTAVLTSPFRGGAKLTGVAGRGLQKLTRMTPKFVRSAGKLGIAGGLVLGGIAMVGFGMMRGAARAASDVVTRRKIQDQRFARNITMMSRLGYTSGTSSMDRFGHTVGLTQALSANRHGRGGGY